MTSDALWGDAEGTVLTPFGHLLLAVVALDVTPSFSLPPEEVSPRTLAVLDGALCHHLRDYKEKVTRGKAADWRLTLVTAVCRGALALAPAGAAYAEGHRELALTLAVCANALLTRYWRHGREADLEAAITGYDAALADPALDAAARANCQMNQANALLSLYKRYRWEDYLDTAITGFNAALVDPDLAAIDRPCCQMNRANALLTRYRRHGQEKDLKAAITGYDAALADLDLAAADHPRCQMGRANALVERYERDGRKDDLEAAITGYDAALADPDLDAADHPPCQMNRANALLTRYRCHGQEKDLKAAITGYDAALADRQLPTAARPLCQMGRANALMSRYQRHGREADMEAAITGYDAALRDPDLSAAATRPTCQMNRATALLTRYERHGRKADLEAAIRGCDAALGDPALDAANRPTCQMNRASALLTRYRRHGREDDLAAALKGYESALADSHLPAADRPLCQMNRAIALITRYQRHEQEDLDAAITSFTAALADPALPRPLHHIALTARGECQLLAFHPDLALADLRHATTLLDAHLASFAAQAGQHYTLLVTRDPYPLATQAALALAATEQDPATRAALEREAWQFVERGRARLTRLALRATAATAPPGSSTARLHRALARIEQRLATTLTALMTTASTLATAPTTAPTADGTRVVALIPRPPSSDHARAAETAITALEARHARLLTTLVHRHPALQALQPAPTLPDLAAVQALLAQVPDGAALLECALLPDGSFALFLLTPATFAVFTAPLDPEALARYSAAFAPADGENAARSARLDGDGSHALGWLNDLLTPLLGDALDDARAALAPAIVTAPDRAPHLLIVPAGDLHTWPLAALPLFQGFAPIILPAATTLADLAVRPVTPGPYHGFAPPTNLRFPRPQALMEAALLGGMVTLGADATLAALAAVRGGSLGVSPMPPRTAPIPSPPPSNSPALTPVPSSPSLPLRRWCDSRASGAPVSSCGAARCMARGRNGVKSGWG